MNETCDHEVTNPRLSGDVMVHTDDEITVSGRMELIDIWVGHMTGHMINTLKLALASLISIATNGYEKALNNNPIYGTLNL